MQFNDFSKTEKQGHKIWPQIVTLLLALSTSVYMSLSQASQWFYLIPIILTLAALFLLARDSGVFDWSRRKMQAASANWVARCAQPAFVKQIKKARVYQDLVRELQNGVEWVGPVPGQVDIPNFVTMHFDNWYNEVLSSTENMKVRRAVELALLGGRFKDFLFVLNSHYLSPYSDALRAGKARYKTEQAMKSLQQAKGRYDRFLETYNDFCENLNDKTKERMLVSIYYIPAAMDWSAGQKS